MRESEYTRSVDRLLPSSVYHLKLNLAHTAGVADSWYSGSRADLWVEWKYLHRVPRFLNLCGEGKSPILSRLQQDWLKCRAREGRSTAVIVGSPEGAVIYPELTWQRVLTREEFRVRLRDKHAVAAWITQWCVGPYGSTETLLDSATFPLAVTDSHS